jgi:transcriptional regulator with XRE-family HTH domain
MAKIYISFLHNYIINIVRLLRLELGISQKDLSKEITPLSDTNLVGLIESNKTSTTYNDDHLNKIAKCFSGKAKELGNEKESYNVHDFYPEEAVSEFLVEKNINQIPPNLHATGTLNLLLENNDTFFNDWHTIREITDHCNVVMKKSWKSTDFTSIVTRAQSVNKLARSGEINPTYKKA